MTIDFDWAGFRALAKRLDDLLAGDSGEPEFAPDLRRAITFLYTAGLTMPAASDVYEDAGEEFWSSAVTLKLDAPDPAELEESATALAQRIITSVDAVQPDGAIRSVCMRRSGSGRSSSTNGALLLWRPSRRCMSCCGVPGSAAAEGLVDRVRERLYTCLRVALVAA